MTMIDESALGEMYVQPIRPAEATGAVRELYDADLRGVGYLTTDTTLFSLRPAVYHAWEGLVMSVRKNLRFRTYELVTLAAARALRCRACISAHASLLLNNGVLDRAQLEAIMRDFRDAGLSDVEVAMMELAEKVATDAHRVTRRDVDALRALGLSDTQVFDVVLAAAARSFYSKSLEALGVPPSPELTETNDLLDLVP